MTEQSETLVKAGPIFQELKTTGPCQLTQALSEPNAATGTGTGSPSLGPWLWGGTPPTEASGGPLQTAPCVATDYKDCFHVSKNISTLNITELET